MGVVSGGSSNCLSLSFQGDPWPWGLWFHDVVGVCVCSSSGYATLFCIDCSVLWYITVSIKAQEGLHSPSLQKKLCTGTVVVVSLLFLLYLSGHHVLWIPLWFVVWMILINYVTPSTSGVCESLGRVNHGEGRCYSAQLSNLRRMAVDLVGAILRLVMNHWVENKGGVIERFVFTFWYENVSVMSRVQSNVFVVVVWSHFSSQEKSSVLRKHTRIYSNYNIASWLWLETFLEIQKRPIFSMTF